MAFNPKSGRQQNWKTNTFRIIKLYDVRESNQTTAARLAAIQICRQIIKQNVYFLLFFFFSN